MEAALSLFHGLLSAVIYLSVPFLFLGMDLSCLLQQTVDLLISEDSSEKPIIPRLVFQFLILCSQMIIFCG